MASRPASSRSTCTRVPGRTSGRRRSATRSDSRTASFRTTSSCATSRTPKASKGPALMEHQQVVTFFHEFGHLVHGIVRGNVVEWARLGRPAENDFMEAPSRFLEDYIFELDVLRRFAKHVETGASIPEDLVKRLQAARDFGRGIAVEQSAVQSRQSLRLHDGDPMGHESRAVARDVAARES